MENLNQIQEDLLLLIKIEKLIKIFKLTKKDYLKLKRLAGKGIPRAEYVCGLYAYFWLKDVELAQKWFQRCRKHANEYFLMKIDFFYQLVGN